MSLVNDLIRRAREEPDELTINDNQVGTLAAHAGSSLPGPANLLHIEQGIRAGNLTFMGIPLRVVGQPKP